jgi:hypothetical protein
MPRGSGTRPLFLYNGSLTSLMPSGRTADATLDSHAVAVAQTAHETNAGACCEQNVALGRCVRQCTLSSSRPSRATTPSLPTFFRAPTCAVLTSMHSHVHSPHTHRYADAFVAALNLDSSVGGVDRVIVESLYTGALKAGDVDVAFRTAQLMGDPARAAVVEPLLLLEETKVIRIHAFGHSLLSLQCVSPLCSLNAFTSLSSHPLHLLSSLAVLFSLSPLHSLHSQHSTSFFLCPKSCMFTNAPQRAHMQQPFAHSSDARAHPFPPHR